MRKSLSLAAVALALAGCDTQFGLDPSEPDHHQVPIRGPVLSDDRYPDPSGTHIPESLPEERLNDAGWERPEGG